MPLDAVLPLRHSVLRAGRPLESAISRSDSSPETVHLGAYVDGDLAGVVSTFPEDCDLAPGRRGEHFRGMATHPSWRGRGVGEALMRAVAMLAREHGADVVWANGRDSALGFYERMGFTVEGQGFEDDVMHLGHHAVVASVEDVARRGGQAS